MSSTNVLHICLNVMDASDSIAFYEQFGFTESWEFTTPDGDTTNYYIADDASIELQLSQTNGETDLEMGSGWDHLALGVNNVDESIRSADHFGVAKEPGPQPEAGAYTAFIEDPDGHLVELIEPMEG